MATTGPSTGKLPRRGVRNSRNRHWHSRGEETWSDQKRGGGSGRGQGGNNIHSLGGRALGPAASLCEGTPSTRSPARSGVEVAPGCLSRPQAWIRRTRGPFESWHSEAHQDTDVASFAQGLAPCPGGCFQESANGAESPAACDTNRLISVL